MITTMNKRHATGAIQRGFTLLEVVVVIALVSIITALAVPSFNASVRRDELLAVGDAVSGFIYDSRALALAQKRCVRVAPVNTAGSMVGDGVLVRQLTMRLLNSADCETGTAINTAANWQTLSYIRDLTLDRRFELQMSQANNAGGHAIWRPSGFLRGNANENLSDDEFSIRIEDVRTTPRQFIVVRARVSGELCTGQLNQAVPAC